MPGKDRLRKKAQRKSMQDLRRSQTEQTTSSDLGTCIHCDKGFESIYEIFEMECGCKMHTSHTETFGVDFLICKDHPIFCVHCEQQIFACTEEEKKELATKLNCDVDELDYEEYEKAIKLSCGHWLCGKDDQCDPFGNKIKNLVPMFYGGFGSEACKYCSMDVCIQCGVDLRPMNQLNTTECGYDPVKEPPKSKQLKCNHKLCSDCLKNLPRNPACPKCARSKFTFEPKSIQNWHLCDKWRWTVSDHPTTKVTSKKSLSSSQSIENENQHCIHCRKIANIPLECGHYMCQLCDYWITAFGQKDMRICRYCSSEHCVECGVEEDILYQSNEFRLAIIEDNKRVKNGLIRFGCNHMMCLRCKPKIKYLFDYEITSLDKCRYCTQNDGFDRIPKSIHEHFISLPEDAELKQKSYAGFGGIYDLNRLKSNPAENLCSYCNELIINEWSNAPSGCGCNIHRWWCLKELCKIAYETEKSVVCKKCNKITISDMESRTKSSKAAAQKHKKKYCSEYQCNCCGEIFIGVSTKRPCCKTIYKRSHWLKFAQPKGTIHRCPSCNKELDDFYVEYQ